MTFPIIDVDALLARASGPVSRVWFCAICSGEAVPGYALCEPCQREAINRERGRRVGKARATIPDTCRDAGFGTDTLRARVCSGDRATYERAIAGAWTWAKSPVDTLTILGGAGRGKTSLAAAVALAVCDAGASADATDAAYDRARRVLWVDVSDLAAARRRHSLGADEAPLVRRAIGASLLVIDELGTERGDSGWTTDAVRDVIWARFGERRPTVVTSPLDRAALGAKYGGGGERRLFEPPRAVVLDLGGARP